MQNSEVKDYTRLAYYNIYKYYPHASNKEDLASDLLVVALEKEPLFDESCGAKKTTFLSMCMKHHLFRIMRFSKRNGSRDDYYLGKRRSYIEEMNTEEIEEIEERRLSKGVAEKMLYNVLRVTEGYKTVELVLEYSSIRDISPAKVFGELLDRKLEDMFLHNKEYALCLNRKPKFILDSSYIIHWRYMVPRDQEKTFGDIADSYGITRQRVQQKEADALAFINKKLDNMFSFDFRSEHDICDWRHPCNAI